MGVMLLALVPLGYYGIPVLMGTAALALWFRKWPDFFALGVLSAPIALWIPLMFLHTEGKGLSNLTIEPLVLAVVGITLGGVALKRDSPRRRRWGRALFAAGALAALALHLLMPGLP